MWDKKWDFSKGYLTVEYTKIAPISFRRPWFHNHNLSRAYIA